MDRTVLTRGLRNPTTRGAVIRKFCVGRSVLDIGCVNHLLENRERPDWLHGQVKQVARALIGVDYMPSAVERLRGEGFDVICGDATKPLPARGPFDVILIGNLIEHLSNFEGLFENIRSLLAEDGVVLISTANPFYRDQYFYSAFKNDIIVNPEHTCWLDPVTLDQLAQRFGFATEAVEWIKSPWQLPSVVLHGGTRRFDIFSGQWRFQGAAGFMERWLGGLLNILARLLLPGSVYTRLGQIYGADLPRFLWLKAESYLFSIAWRIYRSVIVTSPINKFELYLSVLRPRQYLGGASLNQPRQESSPVTAGQ
jgi:SAM-dependent methyltransferase